ncbi:hypothetical protein [Muricoccus radiodurans]|uniref:hypothetical protein n=1 Tax=Muricoccus radiodurans TaxID=2231721 RepID=UPI003CE7737E
MVKRRKQEQVVGVLEFAGYDSDDSTFKQWVAEHRTQNGGSIRVSKGATGVRVMFGREADMAFWKARFETEVKARKSRAA